MSPIPFIPGVFGGNIFAFRCSEARGETHVDISPAAGPGWSYAGKGLDNKKVEAIKQAIAAGSYSGWGFTAATAVTPFNFHDLEKATVTNTSASAAYGSGYQVQFVRVTGKIYYRNKFGELLHGLQTFLSNVNMSGEVIQLGVGASSLGGPLIKIR